MPNKFVKLVHLVGFIIKKFVTMHGHTNVKNDKTDLQSECYSSVGKTQKHRGKTDVGIWGRLRASIRA